jgi:polar amino acid transport system substrate-binding protein
MIKAMAITIATALAAGCATAPTVTDAVRKDLAPTGKLRGGMNLSNTLFTTKDAKTGELQGVSVDLMRELGTRLGVPVEFDVHPTPGEVADAVDRNTWDVATLAIEQARAQRIAFSPPMTEIEATYAVPKDSKITAVAQVDAPGIRISVPDKAGYELYLTRTIKNATLIKSKGTPAAVELFTKKGADALGGLRPALLDTLPKMPDARLLEGNFMTVNHGLGTPRAGRTGAGADYLKAFVEEMVATGFIARSIEKHGVKGLAAIAK